VIFFYRYILRYKEVAVGSVVSLLLELGGDIVSNGIGYM